METLKVSSWQEFLDVLQNIRLEYQTRSADGFSPLILYRGLSDSNWKLETTLERQFNSSWSIKKYYMMVYTCAPQIESFLESSWNLGSQKDLFSDINDFSEFSADLPHYEYWAYLRHNGFPSPLLDWSKSPYIALFFAFCEQSKADYASLYVYVESAEGGKGGIVGAPMITVKEPYIKTHKRHFLQQSYYTIATEINAKNPKDHTFVPHESVFQMNRKDQDILKKIVLPRSIRRDILTILNDYNINYYSLFQTEDSLIKSLALLKEIDIPLI